MRRMEQGGTGTVKACVPAYKITHIFYSKQSLLLNTEAKSQGFISLLCSFLLSSLCPALRATAVSPGVESHSTVMLTAALHLSHLLSKYSTNTRHEYLQKVPPNYS